MLRLLAITLLAATALAAPAGPATTTTMAPSTTVVTTMHSSSKGSTVSMGSTTMGPSTSMAPGTVTAAQLEAACFKGTSKSVCNTMGVLTSAQATTLTKNIANLVKDGAKTNGTTKCGNIQVRLFFTNVNGMSQSSYASVINALSAHYRNMSAKTASCQNSLVAGFNYNGTANVAHNYAQVVVGSDLSVGSCGTWYQTEAQLEVEGGANSAALNLVSRVDSQLQSPDSLCGLGGLAGWLIGIIVAFVVIFLIVIFCCIACCCCGLTCGAISCIKCCVDN